MNDKIMYPELSDLNNFATAQAQGKLLALIKISFQKQKTF